VQALLYWRRCPANFISASDNNGGWWHGDCSALRRYYSLVRSTSSRIAASLRAGLSGVYDTIRKTGADSATSHCRFVSRAVRKTVFTSENKPSRSRWSVLYSVSLGWPRKIAACQPALAVHNRYRSYNCTTVVAEVSRSLFSLWKHL